MPQRAARHRRRGASVNDTVKYVLDESRIPKVWYNLAGRPAEAAAAGAAPGHAEAGRPRRSRAALPDGADPAGGDRPSARSRSPEPVRDVYRQWRPTPLYRARRLEKVLQTPARIYYKYEGVSPAGSHKPNTAVAQAFYNQQAGVKTLVDRDRRRPVGQLARVRRRAVRARRAGVHGARVLRPEAVPPRADGDLRRALHRRRRRPRRSRAARSSRSAPIIRAASASRSPRRSRSPRSATTPSTRSAAC